MSGFGPPPGGGSGFGPPPGGGGGFGVPPGGGGGFGPPPGGGGDAPMHLGAPGDGPAAHIAFTPDQESQISGAGKVMMAAGALTLLSALVGLVNSAVLVFAPVNAGLPEDMRMPIIGVAICGGGISTVIAVVFGAWLIMGSRALDKVVTSDEADQANLMAALRKLRQVFMLKAALIIGLVLIICLGAGIGIMVGGVMAATMR